MHYSTKPNTGVVELEIMCPTCTTPSVTKIWGGGGRKGGGVNEEWNRNERRIGVGKEFVPTVMHGCKAAVRGRVREGAQPPPAQSTEAQSTSRYWVVILCA